MSVAVVVVGGGAHAREVLQILRDMARVGADIHTTGIVADGQVDRDLLAAVGVTVLGSVASLGSFRDRRFVVAIGSGDARARIDQEVRDLIEAAPPLVHPQSWVADEVELGLGSVLFAGARVNVNSRIGRHSHLNTNVSVSHDCSIGSYVTIGPGCTLAGRVAVGRGATIWSGATVIPEVSIGAGAIVGAGAVVIEDVPPGATVVGVPARVIS